MEEDLDEMITMEEAAAIVKVTADHLRLQARKKKLKAKKSGNTWLTTRRAINEWEKTYRHKPGPHPKK